MTELVRRTQGKAASKRFREHVPLWTRAVLFLVVVPGSVAGWIPRLLATPNAALPRAHILGLPLAIGGWLVLLYCTRDFARSGQGTPAPYDPPRKLVTKGLYRFVRNPMYLAVVSSVLSQALWYWSRGVAFYAVAIWVAFHARILLYEEPALKRLFGREFDRYREAVPRWVPTF